MLVSIVSFCPGRSKSKISNQAKKGYVVFKWKAWTANFSMLCKNALICSLDQDFIIYIIRMMSNDNALELFPTVGDEDS